MAHIKALKDVYAEEMKDLWSANLQMARMVKELSEKAHDGALKNALDKSIADIGEHTDTLKGLLYAAGEAVEAEHCKGMAGLVKEAKHHVEKHAPRASDLLDIVIIAQYQRMSHYGLAGFGTAAAYAKALGLKDHQAKLTHIVRDIYNGDDFATKLATKAETMSANAAKAA
jgi:ferritin-like metal-binding protein YciE